MRPGCPGGMERSSYAQGYLRSGRLVEVSDHKSHRVNTSTRSPARAIRELRASKQHRGQRMNNPSEALHRNAKELEGLCLNAAKHVFCFQNPEAIAEGWAISDRLFQETRESDLTVRSFVAVAATFAALMEVGASYGHNGADMYRHGFEMALQKFFSVIEDGILSERQDQGKSEVISGGKVQIISPLDMRAHRGIANVSAELRVSVRQAPKRR